MPSLQYGGMLSFSQRCFMLTTCGKMLVLIFFGFLHQSARVHELFAQRKLQLESL